MQKTSGAAEDFARLMSSLAGTISGLGSEAESRMKERLRDMLARLDFVERDEFETVRDLARKALAETQALRAEIEQLKAGRTSGPGGGG